MDLYSIWYTKYTVLVTAVYKYQKWKLEEVYLFCDLHDNY